MSSTGAISAPSVFTLYTVDVKYNSKSCHIQKYSDDAGVHYKYTRSGMQTRLKPAAIGVKKLVPTEHFQDQRNGGGFQKATC